MFVESQTRTILKTLSWRVVATITTMGLVLGFTRRLDVMAAVGGLEVVAKLLFYYLHERGWNAIKAGRHEVRPYVLWLTGLPASGKTALADMVAERLRKQGFKVERLDSHDERELFPSVGFTKAERDLHVRRVGHLAAMLEKQGVIVVASFVSPYRESRDAVRAMCQRFIEVHVATPVAVCEQRDERRLYERARAGEIANFTGISDPYEAPTAPELIVSNEGGLESSAQRVLEVCG